MAETKPPLNSETEYKQPEREKVNCNAVLHAYDVDERFGGITTLFSSGVKSFQKSRGKINYVGSQVLSINTYMICGRKEVASEFGLKHLFPHRKFRGFSLL